MANGFRLGICVSCRRGLPPDGRYARGAIPTCASYFPTKPSVGCNDQGRARAGRMGGHLRRTTRQATAPAQQHHSGALPSGLDERPQYDREFDLGTPVVGRVGSQAIGRVESSARIR
ncbi:hypothetical protein D9M71_289830 [compost metagenome]